MFSADSHAVLSYIIPLSTTNMDAHVEIAARLTATRILIKFSLLSDNWSLQYGLITLAATVIFCVYCILKHTAYNCSVIKRHTNSGFTLIELSIVLIIIGLVAASVLVGRDLIFAARVRQQVTMIEQLNTAANAFRNKYGCLPGDCVNGEDFGFDPLADGDGDGRIFSTKGWYMMNIPPVEPVNFFYQLSQANMIAGTYQFYDMVGPYQHGYPGKLTPALKMDTRQATGMDNAFISGKGGIVPISLRAWSEESGGDVDFTNLFSDTNKNYWFLTGTLIGRLPSSYTYPPGILPAFDAYSLDAKIDDGLPLTGIMRSIYGQTTDGPFANPGWGQGSEITGPACVYSGFHNSITDPTQVTYNFLELDYNDQHIVTSRRLILCAPLIAASF
jgi:prepilin-type N-terminal cleavage/methylation domain-containing protein